MSKRHQYRLDIATARGMTDDESQRCLRATLKMMLRSYGVRCTSAVEVQPHDDTDTRDSVTNPDSRIT